VIVDFDVADLKVAAGIVIFLHSGMLYVLVADQVAGLGAIADIAVDGGVVAHVEKLVPLLLISKVVYLWYN
jgi:hypothetical protein